LAIDIVFIEKLVNIHYSTVVFYCPAKLMECTLNQY